MLEAVCCKGKHHILSHSQKWLNAHERRLPGLSVGDPRTDTSLSVCLLPVHKSCVMHFKVGTKLLQSNFCCQACAEQRLVIQPLA